MSIRHTTARHAALAVLAVGALGTTLLAAAATGAPTAQGISLITDATGGGISDAGGYSPILSADGNWVVFYSASTNLIAGDTNGNLDVFVRNLATGQTSLASVATDGTPSNGMSWNAGISADGRYVVFQSDATTLDSTKPASANVYVRDTVAGTTKALPIRHGVGDDDPLAISQDGTRIAYGDWSDFTLRLYDTTTSTSSLIATKAWGATLSADGRRVAFVSNATDLVPGDVADTNVFVRDLTTGSVQKVPQPNAPAGSQTDATISADGLFVGYRAQPGGDDYLQEAFVWDLAAGSVAKVSVDAAGQRGNDDSIDTVVSSGGRYVAFSSRASNLVEGDTNGKSDVFYRDLVAGTTRIVSLGLSGSSGNQGSDQTSISADGQLLGFYSGASDLVSGDTNGVGDLFSWKATPHVVVTPTTTPTTSTPTTTTTVSSPSGTPTVLPPSGTPTSSVPGTPAAVTATRAKLTKQQAKRAQAGKRFTVKIKVASDTATPTGKVRVRIKGKGAPTKARKGLVKTLTNGKVKVKFPALPKGKYKIKTIYLGTDAFAASTAKLIKVRVR